MDVHYAMQLFWDPRICQTLTSFGVLIQPLQIVVARHAVDTSPVPLPFLPVLPTYGGGPRQCQWSWQTCEGSSGGGRKHQENGTHMQAHHKRLYVAWYGLIRSCNVL